MMKIPWEKSGEEIREAPEKGRLLVIAGGGTGGHLLPGVAVADAFMQHSHANRVVFVTTGRPVEKRVLAGRGYETVRIEASGFKGTGASGKVRALARMFSGVFSALRLFRKQRPDAVLGMGAYSAAPVVLAAWMLGIFRAIHEQNRLPGMTNRLLARFSNRVYVSFEDTDIRGCRESIVFTGNPVRRDIAECGAEARKQAPADFLTVLVLGGSQGAHQINKSVKDALEWLDEPGKFRFIHQSGEADLEEVREGYADAGVSGRVEAFFDDMAACYREADIAVCRAGATSIAEIAAAGLPAVFIPYPYAADNHQYFNAKPLAEAGAAELIEQSEADGKTLARRLNRYAADRAALGRMKERAAGFSKPDAADVLVSDICRSLGV